MQSRREKKMADSKKILIIEDDQDISMIEEAYLQAADQVCREIRDKVDIPILMVTARTESVDKIRGAWSWCG